MNQNLIHDLIVYFAKFPELAGVLKNFHRKESKLVNYEPLKVELSALDPNSLLPDIKSYVLGVNEESITKVIGDIQGIYMFVDYGAINIERDDMRRENGTFNIAVTIAIPCHKGDIDMMEDMLLAEKTLMLIKSVRDTMIEDQKCGEAFVQDISFPHEITPWYSRLLHNSTGWTMAFQKAGIELI